MSWGRDENVPSCAGTRGDGGRRVGISLRNPFGGPVRVPRDASLRIEWDAARRQRGVGARVRPARRESGGDDLGWWSRWGPGLPSLATPVTRGGCWPMRPPAGRVRVPMSTASGSFRRRGAQAYAEREGVPVMVITASHNPPPYNGVKLVGSDGVELSISALEDIEETLLAESFTVASWDETGRVRDIDGVKREYVDGLLAATDREVIADADLTVALDPGHGAGSLTSPEFFRELGCRVVTVNAQPDGHFPVATPNRFRTTSRTSVGSSGRPTPTSASPTTATPTARFSSTRTATTSRATPRSPRSPPPPNSRPATPPSPRSTSPSDSSTWWSPRSGPNSS